jgi:broad specificity phosphatase PhoE
MCQVVIVQHGEKTSGPGDPGLTLVGVDQARRTAEALQDIGAPSALLSSPLRRAQQTAEPLARKLKLDVEIDDRLSERMNWDGSGSFADFIDEWQRASSNRDYIPAIGDSSKAAGRRFLEALLDHCRHHQDLLIAVAHGGVTIDLLRTILDDKTVMARWPKLIGDGMPPCGLTRLSLGPAGFVVDSAADVSHL